MDEKEKLIMSSIGKLLQEKAEDDEIIDSLTGLGLSEEEAKQYLAEAKKRIESGQGEYASEDDSLEKIISDSSKEQMQEIGEGPEERAGALGGTDQGGFETTPEAKPIQSEKTGLLERILGKKPAAKAGEKEKAGKEKVKAPEKETLEKPGSFWEAKPGKYWGETEKASKKKSGLFDSLKKMAGKKKQVGGLEPELSGKREPVKEIRVKSALEETLEGGKETEEAAGKYEENEEKPKQQKPVEEDGTMQESASSIGEELGAGLLELEEKTKTGREKRTASKHGKEKKETGKTLRAQEQKAGETEKPAAVQVRPRPRGKLTLLIIPNREYSRSIGVIAKYLSDNYSKVAYISLNELYDTLQSNLKANKVDVDRMIFVDAITRTAQTRIQKTSNCTFVTSPNDLVELSLAITDVLNKGNVDALLFDSLSTLLIYEKEKTATKFIHSLIGKIKAVGGDSVLTALEGDANREAIRNLQMFVDEVLTMSQFQINNLQQGYDELDVKQEEPAEPIGKALMGALKELEISRPAVKAVAKRGNEKEIIGQLGELKKQLSGIEARPSHENEFKKFEEQLKKLEARPKPVEAAPAIQKELRELKKQLKKIQGRPKVKVIDSRKAVREALKKIEERLVKIKPKQQKQQPVNQLKKELRKLAEKIRGISGKGEKEKTSKIIEKEWGKLEKRFKKIEKQPGFHKELKGLSEKIGKIKAKPLPKKYLKKIEERFDRMEKKIGKDDKMHRAEMKKQQRIQETKDKAEKQVKALERKLSLLNKSYSLGVISEGAYLKDKSRIEKLLKK